MQPATSLLIKNLMPGLTERGKIKIGEKGRTVKSAKGTEFQPPKKLDHFRVTTLERGADDNYLLDREVHDMYGDAPRVLPVRLLYNEIDLNFQSRYCCYTGKTLFCSGDGEVAFRLKSRQNGAREPVTCPCERQDPTYNGPEKCKINGGLAVIIDGVSRVGGVWKFRTTSFNSVVGITSSMALIQSLTGGLLAGLPLQLTLNPKTAIIPTTGQASQIWVVGLEFKGSVDQLQQVSYERAQQNALHHARMEQIEVNVRKLIAHDPVSTSDDAAEIIEEFYPEQASQSQSPQSGETSTEPAPAQQQPQPENNGTEENTARRARRNKYPVNPDHWNGKTELITCGSTPEQLAKIRAFARDHKELIQSYMDSVGYKEISFLRQDEADELIETISAISAPDTEPEPAQVPAQTPPAQEPEPTPEPTQAPAPTAAPVEEPNGEKVECPVSGETVYKTWCMSSCKDRARDGWCPSIDEPPANGLI